MKTINATAFRKDLYRSLNNVIEFNQPLTVSTKKGNAVILSEEDYNSLIETMYLDSQKGLVKAIKEGEKGKISDMKEFDPEEEW